MTRTYGKRDTYLRRQIEPLVRIFTMHNVAYITLSVGEKFAAESKFPELVFGTGSNEYLEVTFFAFIWHKVIYTKVIELAVSIIIASGQAVAEVTSAGLELHVAEIFIF